MNYTAPELGFHLFNTVILTAVVSLFVLWRYRVTIVNGMTRGGNEPLPLPDIARRNEGGASQDLGKLFYFERRRQLEIAFAYALTTFVCALPLAAAYTYTVIVEDPTTPLRLSITVELALVYTLMCAPLILASLWLPIIEVIIGLALLTALLMTLSFGAAFVEWAVRGFPHQWLSWTPAEFLTVASDQLWMIVLYWIPTWPRRLRGVAPITFAALLLFGFVPFFAARLTGDSVYTFNAMFVLVALPIGGLAWMRLYQLSKSYDRKRFSDGQLLSRAWWLLLVCSVVLVQSSGKVLGFAMAAGAASLLLFPLVNGFLLSKARRRDQIPVRTLLLLRVFGHTARMQRLFDRIGTRWRLFGPVTMIAAPDVVARTIRPDDYLRWLTGRADEIFVRSRADLDAKLSSLDTAPDPDSRYRISAFCCRDNTWQATIVELMQCADAVLIDARGLTTARHGVEFELEQLAQRLPSRRMVILIDQATERPMLESAFGRELANVRLVNTRHSRDDGRVFEALLNAAA